MPPDQNSDPTNASAPDTIGHGISCVNCGYTLRSLSISRNCPECGCPAEHSLHGDWIRYANRAWSGKIERSLRWLLISRKILIITLLCIFVGAIAGLILTPRDRDSALEVVLEFAIAGISVIAVSSLVVAGIGLWMISDPEPRSKNEKRYGNAARRALSGMVIPALGWWAVVGGTQLDIGRLSEVSQNASVSACFVVVWLHMLVLIELARDLERRCVVSVAPRMLWLRRCQAFVLCLGSVALAVYWLGPVRWFDGGAWRLPPQKTQLAAFGFAFVCWVLVTGLLRGTLRAINEELHAAPSGVLIGTSA